MSHPQDELDLDTWWQQLDLEGSDILSPSGAYAPSMSNWLVEANQIGDTMQLSEAGYHHGKQADDGSPGLGYPPGGWGPASIESTNTMQAESIAWEAQQDCLQHWDRQLDQFMQTFEQDMELQDEGLKSSHEPSLRETSFSGCVGSGYCYDQHLGPNSQNLSLYTSDVDDQVSRERTTITQIDQQQGPLKVSKKGDLDSVKPKLRIPDQLPRRGRPPTRSPEASGSPSHLKPSYMSKSIHISDRLSTNSTDDATSTNEASIIKYSQDDIQFQEASIDEDLARTLTHFIQSDIAQLTPHPAALGRAHASEPHKGSLKPGSHAKLYYIRREDGQDFDYEGEPVPSALICSNRNVIALTGISLRALQCAQQNTDILWDPWKVTYLKTVHSNHDITHNLLRETSVLSSQLGSGSNESRDGPVRDISLTSSKKGYSLGTQNQLEQCQSSNEPVSTVLVPSEHNLPSSDSIILAAGFQSSDITGVIGSREKTVVHTKRQRRAPHSVATRMKMQKRAVNRNQSISDTTRARMLDHAHQHLVERVNGTSFDYNGQPVHFAIIQSRCAASKFLACDVKTILRALQKRGKQKGIVKRIWRVKDLGSPIRPA